MISNITQQRHNIPREYLTHDELLNGCKVLLDSGADTCVAGKHAWVVDVIEGISATAHGFDDSASSLENLPIVNVKYAYDRPDTGEVVILEINHCIYMGNKKVDAIAY